jgi:hypothetical protein
MKTYRTGFLLAVIGNIVLASVLAGVWWHSQTSRPTTTSALEGMKPIAAPIVGGMITSTIHVLILVPVFFAFAAERAEARKHGSFRIGSDWLASSRLMKSRRRSCSPGE